MKCKNMDNIGNCCLTIGHISCTCRSRNERITALRKAELAATVPPVAAANNRSDEIAWLEGTLKDCDGYFFSSDDYVFIKTRINERIAQLRAMR